MQAVLFSWHSCNAQQLAHATIGDVARFGTAGEAPPIVAELFKMLQDTPDLTGKGHSVGTAILGFLKEPKPSLKVNLLPLGLNHIAVTDRHIAAQLQCCGKKRAASAPFAIAPHTLKEAGSCLHSHQSCVMSLSAPSLPGNQSDKMVRWGELDIAHVHGKIHDAANQSCYSPCLLELSSLYELVDNRLQVRKAFDLDNGNIPDIRHVILDASLFTLKPLTRHIASHEKILVSDGSKGSGIRFGLGLLLNLFGLFLLVGIDAVLQKQANLVSLLSCSAKACLRCSPAGNFDNFGGACQAAPVDPCSFVFA